MKVLYEVRDSKGCNYTKSSDISSMSWRCDGDKRAPNRVGMIRRLIVKCGDVMTRAQELGAVINHHDRVEGMEIRYWILQLEWDLI